jgi:molybdenum cofactor guanylyltransferase
LAWSGAVLCGGRSRRMGTDKALLPIDGEPMAKRVATALEAAGATQVIAVGGDAAALAGLGLSTVPDVDPMSGNGPLVGIVTALEALESEIVLVVGCDLVSPSAEAMAATVAALGAVPDGDVGVPSPGGGGIPQWLHAAWRRSVVRPLADQLSGGERAVHRAVAAAALRVVEVTGLAAATLADADTPADLPPHVRGHEQ